jgi:Zn-dependent peptidase ImmA (M78 family)
MNRREAILLGAQVAATLHESLQTRPNLERKLGGIDVFGALLREHVALLFRPLSGLLGCCIPGDVPGVMISTERPLRIQRFTGAHELGHVALGHAISLDGEEILTRGGSAEDLQEVAADSFASSFLLPRWLLQMHGRRQGWTREDLLVPHVIYQLSLRMGASFHATTVALERYGMIDAASRDRLLARPRRELKAEILAGLEVDDYRRDVWLLTEKDEGTTIEGAPGDLFLLKLHESGSAGYLWDTHDLLESGFAILRDHRAIPTQVAGNVTREVTTAHANGGRGAIRLAQKRSFQPEAPAIKEFVLSFDLDGKEIGLPRAYRRQMMRA